MAEDVEGMGRVVGAVEDIDMCTVTMLREVVRHVLRQVEVMEGI